MRAKLVIGNWKLNGNFEFNEQLIGALSRGLAQRGIDHEQRVIGICPPAIYLHQCNGLLADSQIMLGAQDLSEETSGAFTGDVSGIMLKELGCKYVLVGHSERRARYAESSQSVANKAKVAISAGLIPVICLGESLKEREEGQTEAVVAEQLQAVIDLLQEDMSRVVLAYEPVWAIGTGKTATPEQAQDVHRFIRFKLAKLDEVIASKVQILYGGSVKADNAAELFSMPDIDGGLIGGASLQAEEFLAICQAGLVN